MMKRCLLTFALFSPFVLLSQSVDTLALNKLIDRAKETHSSALVVYHNDKLILNQCFDKSYIPLNTMSVTKSFVNLGIGLLVTQKLISIDDPVYYYYPEWNYGLKREVTIRHLLNHTSGLKSSRLATNIYRSPNYVQFALCAEVVDTPGLKFFYNNKAVNLLAGIIQKASGIRMDYYLNQNVFQPLEIKDFVWHTDSFLFHPREIKDYVWQTGAITYHRTDSLYLKKGNPIGMANLMMKANDMAKIGLLVLHKGNWKGKQIIAESWFEESMKPGQPFNSTYGLLWWLIYDPITSYVTFDNSNTQKLEQVGLNTDIINDLKKITGQYKNTTAFLNAVDTLKSIKIIGGKIGLRNLLWSKGYYDNIYTFNTENSNIIGYAARGAGGQYIIIFPDKKLVTVRTIYSSREPSDKFIEFDILSYQIIK